MNKGIKVLNTFSLLFFAAILLLVYAYLPIEVDLNVEGIAKAHKQTFFYYLFGFFVIINFVLRIGVGLGTRHVGEEMTGWVSSIIFIINFYLTTLTGFVGVLNNSVHIRPESYMYLNYIGPALLIFWVGGLIFLANKNR